MADNSTQSKYKFDFSFLFYKNTFTVMTLKLVSIRLTGKIIFKKTIGQQFIIYFEM